MDRRWKVLAVTSVSVFMGFLDATIVNIAFPAIGRDFPDTSVSGLSWVLNAYNIVFAALLVPSGRLADRIGRRRAFLIGMGAFVAASAACAAAPTVETLIAARVFQAAGAAVLVPVGLALLLPEFAPTQRALAVGLYGAAGGVAAATGPALGGVLIEADWRWVFLVNVPVGLAGLIAGARILVESRDAERGAVPDLVGVVLVTVAMAALALGIVEGEAWGWASGRIVAAFAIAAVTGVAFVLRSRRHPVPVVDLSLFRVPSFALANTGMVLWSAAFYAMLLCNVLFLTTVWGYSTLEAGLAITPAPLLAAAWAAPAGRLADARGQRLVIVPGCVIFALGTLWFATRVGDSPAWVAEWLPGAALTGTGVGLAFAAFSSAAVSSLPPSRFATGAAVNAACRQLGAVLGVAILVAIVGAPGAGDNGFDAGWTFALLSALAAGAVCLPLRQVTVEAPLMPVRA